MSVPVTQAQLVELRAQILEDVADVLHFYVDEDAARQLFELEEATRATLVVEPATMKTVREQSGADFHDSRDALIATGGDVAKAVELLRRQGLA